MDVPFRSSVWLRNDFCQTTVQLRQRPTALLPDGATVYVSADDAIYRLYKGIGTTYDTLGDAVLTPADQTSNRWFLESASGSSPWQGIEISDAGANVTSGGAAQWQALGSSASSFSLPSGDPLMLVVDPTTSLMTYHGPDRLATVRYQVSVLAGSAVTFDCHAAISFNGDIAVGSTAAARSSGEQSATISNTEMACISGERRVVLSNNSTLRLMLRNMGGAQVIEVDFFSLSVSP